MTLRTRLSSDLGALLPTQAKLRNEINVHTTNLKVAITRPVISALGEIQMTKRPMQIQKRRIKLE